MPEAERTVPRVAAALSLGALMGARGNSGVILSQLFRGLGEAVDDVDEIGGARAGPRRSSRAATRPSRRSSQAGRGHDPDRRPRRVDGRGRGARGRWRPGSTCSPRPSPRPRQSVARTPRCCRSCSRPASSTPAARASSCCCAARSRRCAARHEPHGSRRSSTTSPCPPWTRSRPKALATRRCSWSCPPRASGSTSPRSATRLERDGRVGARRRAITNAVKIHIHNERPDEVLAYGLTLGSLSRINVENLDRQATAVRDRVRSRRPTAPMPIRTSARRHRAATATGSGGRGRRRRARAGSQCSRIARRDGHRRGRPERQPIGRRARRRHPRHERDRGHRPAQQPERAPGRQAGRRALRQTSTVEVVPTRNRGRRRRRAAGLRPGRRSQDRGQGRWPRRRARSRRCRSPPRCATRAWAGTRCAAASTSCSGPTDGLVATDRDRTAAVAGGLRKLKPGFELLTLYRGEGVEPRGR